MKTTQASIGSRPGNRWFDNDSRSVNIDGVHIDGTGMASLGSEMSTILINELASVETEDTLYHYKAEEGDGGWFDSSGNGYDSTSFSPSWTTLDGIPSPNHSDGFDTVGTFDGVDDEAVLDSTIVLTGDFSVSFILQMDDSATDNHAIASNVNGTNGFIMTKFETTKNQLAIRVQDGTIAKVVTAQFDLYDGGWHELIVSRTGSVFSFTVGDVTVNPVVESSADVWINKFMQQGATGNFAPGRLASVVMPDNSYEFSNGSGLAVSDGVGTNDLTVDAVEADFWAGRIPVLDDGTSLIGRGSLSNPGGYVHNGSEVSLQQTASTGAFTGDTIWGDGAGPWVKVDYADWLAHIIGTQNTWLRWFDINGVCVLKEIWQYDTGKTLSEGEYNKNVSYVGGASCGEGIIPFP
jgi:hypothetical protein